MIVFTIPEIAGGWLVGVAKGSRDTVYKGFLIQLVVSKLQLESQLRAPSVNLSKSWQPVMLPWFAPSQFSPGSIIPFPHSINTQPVVSYIQLTQLKVPPENTLKSVHSSKLPMFERSHSSPGSIYKSPHIVCL